MKAGMRGLLVLMFTAISMEGCTRPFYRRWADRETYGAIEERNTDSRWAIPKVGIDPPVQSRLHDPFDPDWPPLPPDDPAAYRYMQRVNGIRGYRGWHKNGDAPWIEDPSWRDGLSLDEKGVLVLTPERAVELGILDSPSYQTQLESIYLASLSLTLNRFEFALHWFGTNATTFNHFGSGASELNTLTTASDFGFTRAFATGGQLMVDFANTFVFQFAGPDSTIATSNIAISFMQPLLRGAGREVRLENLTEAERNLLYQIRSFAHFRKSFTFDIATNQYLRLLSQEQQIRNQQANVASVEQNFRLHEELYANGSVDSVKLDQTLQSVQQAQLGLIQAEAALETAQDLYKGTLGLPPNIPIRLDDSILAPFQLNDPALAKLQGDMERFLGEYRELDEAPPLVKLEEGFRRLKGYQKEVSGFVRQIETEIQGWKKLLAEPDDKDRIARERRYLEALLKELEEVRDDLETAEKDIAKARQALAEDKRKVNWEALQDRTRDLIAAAGQLFIIQTQIRVYLIKLKPVPYELTQATQYALANRLDLMNQRAQVVDAWRQIGVTASALKAGLDVVFNANIATPPFGTNPVDFRSGVSNYSVGLRLDGPLNRLAERNVYRASQVAYQRARRAFMFLEDQIETRVRLDLRQLHTAKLNFEITRQSLITAARQVEAAREQLLQLGANADPTSTKNILDALNSVLQFQNALIDSWVNYETGRYQLLLDIEALQLDKRGMYTNEPDDQSLKSSPPGGGSGPEPDGERQP
jgi:outer membrane protein TolC